MNGNRLLLDTNAIVELLNGNSTLNNLIINASWIGISIISVLEYISYPMISKEDIQVFNSFTERIEVIELTSKNGQLLQTTSEIRKLYKLKLPDAIIAATAIINNANLITADKGFNKLNKLLVINF